MRGIRDALEQRLFNYLSSWLFLIHSVLVIVGWVLLANSVDPYPYILLNLFLSCVAALSTPIILIGQSKIDQEKFKQIHEKLDRLLNDD